MDHQHPVAGPPRRATIIRQRRPPLRAWRLIMMIVFVVVPRLFDACRTQRNSTTAGAHFESQKAPGWSESNHRAILGALLAS